MEPVSFAQPEESVAVGAALQCAMKERKEQVEEVVLTDVCPFTLGTSVIRDNGSFEIPGVYLPIIERNTVIPVSRKQTVYTAHDNQKYVDVKILQGESRIADNNILLGKLTVEVPVGPKGQEAIEITYTYDIDALLEVEVKVLSTGVTKNAVIHDEETSLSCTADSFFNDGTGKSVDLDIHLDCRDTVFCTRYLKVHVSEEVLKALDIRKYDIVIIRITRYKTAGNTCNHLLKRYTGSHK
jgi:molecular chaperone DnaK (HSP70)